MDKQMLKIFYVGTFYLGMLLFQTPLPDVTGWERVGGGTAFIIAFFLLFKYFSKQMEKKDEAYQKLAGEVLEVSKQAIAAMTTNADVNKQVLTGLSELNKKL